ncbi:MAG TPA: PAS domain-containing sensor histidine kinase [Cyclobacteriaceae bacterium]|nr:PAS domain-containing sensor histidine kinase [Cyclobacteriaceae bacterium]
MITAETIVNHLNDPVFILDQKCSISYYNRASHRFQHLARRRIEIGVPFTEIVSKEREGVVRTLLRQVIQRNVTETVEAEYRDVGGRPYFFEVTYSPIAEKNSGICVCVVIHDITPQKSYERKSLRLLRDYQHVLENANAMIFGIDGREYVVEWNRECTRVTRFEKNDILAKKIIMLADESGSELRALLKRVLGGEPIYNFELRIRDKEGQSLTILVNVTPKLNDRNDIVGALFVGQDVTELSSYRETLEQQVLDRTEKLKRALEKERELVMIKNRFVSIASHELRSPLASIENEVGCIRSDVTLKDVNNAALDKIEKQVGTMKTLLEDILTLEKQEVQKLKASYHQLDLVAFLDELGEEVLANNKYSHSIIKDVPDSRIFIVCDGKLLRNIFINLLSNAVKFSPDDNRIELSAQLQNDGYVAISIKDHGCGIPPNELEKVVEPFSRGSNVEAIKGTGLGLSIVKRATETLGGILSLESEVSKGTRVVVKLPCSPEI